MRKAELDDFIYENNLLTTVGKEAGVYAITIDGVVVYIGMSKNMYTRCSQHIYNTENAMLIGEKKYLLLLAAKLGGHNIDCITLEKVPEAGLREREAELIDYYSPQLNIMTPSGVHDIEDMRIEELLEAVHENQKSLQ